MNRIAALFAVLFPCTGFALDHNAPGLFCRVVDVGAGLCCVIRMPNNEWVIYDTGSFVDNGYSATKAIMEIIPPKGTISQVFVSHSDSDHLYAMPSIMQLYRVKQVIRSGLQRSSDAWKRSQELVNIQRLSSRSPTDDFNLRFRSNGSITPGTSRRYGDSSSGAELTIIQGFHTPPDRWNLPSSDTSKFRNAGSIVIRIQYKENSILFMGDAVGRFKNSDSSHTIRASEKEMVDNASSVPIKSNVLIAAHHGADNGTSGPLIDEVEPTWVIFSAGHAHEHPRASTALRLTNREVAKEKILRTDLGDNEGGPEWDEGATSQRDFPGDDDIDIHISPQGVLTVEYRNPH